MGLDKVHLTTVLKNKMLIGGVEVGLATQSAPDFIKAGLRTVWGAHDWSWTWKFKTDFVFTANDADGITLPTDCRRVFGVRRTTTSDYGWSLIYESPGEFDVLHPYVDAQDSDSVVRYKVVSDNGTLRLMVFPKSDANDTGTVWYKMVFTEDIALRVMPEEIEKLVLVASEMETLSGKDQAQAMMRQTLLGEYRYWLNEARKSDKLVSEEMMRRREIRRTPAFGTYQHALDIEVTG